VTRLPAITPQNCGIPQTWEGTNGLGGRIAWTRDDGNPPLSAARTEKGTTGPASSWEKGGLPALLLWSTELA
jgi:hypothetical protein